MSFRIGEPPDRDDLAQFPKLARQHELAGRGFPVPPGVVMDLDGAAERIAESSANVDEDAGLAWIRAELEAGRSLIARSASSHEDREQTSGAGLGMSIPGLRDRGALANGLATIEAHARAHLRGRSLVLIQREVPRRWLIVAVRGREPGDPVYMEVHGADAGPEPLAEGRSPAWAGPASDWDDPARPALERLVTEVIESVTPSPETPSFGADLEIVVDPAGQPWLVQARPLTAPLEPGWPAFAAEVTRESGPESLRGSLVLDGEHNPAPLSVGHAWVIHRLARLRPRTSGDPRVLAGWLYVRALPRHLDQSNPKPAADVMSAHEALTWLRDRALPDARAQLRDYAELLASRPAIRSGLDRGEALFLQMIDAYVGRLVPARAQALARAGRSRASQTEVETDPLSLRGRADYLDVLPAVWDIASPSLADLLEPRAANPRAVAATMDAPPPAIPSDELEAARLLGEWDDHLFACGLAPLRQLWLYAAERLGLDRERVFLLDGDELVELDDDRRALGDLDAVLATRAELSRRQRDLTPPSRIVDGHPIPHPFAGRLRGLAIGDSFEGPIAGRRDLRELLADPPPVGAILCIPALTAQAAVALAELGIRAVCTEYGGALAHGALMARELGLSALIGCKGCTRLPEGAQARLDTHAKRLIVRGF